MLIKSRNIKLTLILLASILRFLLPVYSYNEHAGSEHQAFPYESGVFYEYIRLDCGLSSVSQENERVTLQNRSRTESKLMPFCVLSPKSDLPKYLKHIMPLCLCLMCWFSALIIIIYIFSTDGKKRFNCLCTGDVK